MIQDQINLLNRKMEVIEQILGGDISELSKDALKLATIEPSSAAGKAGVVVEGILHSIYEAKCKEIGETPARLAINELKGILGKMKIEIPSTIMKNIDLVQAYRNEGAHYRKGDKINENDLSSILNAFVRVVEWYVEREKGIRPDYSSLYNTMKQTEYQQLLRFAWMDGEVSELERKNLELKRIELDISKEESINLEEIVKKDPSIRTIQKHFLISPKIIKTILGFGIIIISAILSYLFIPTEFDRISTKFIKMECGKYGDYAIEASRKELVESFIRSKDHMTSNSMVQSLEILMEKCKENSLKAAKYNNIDFSKMTYEEITKFYVEKTEGSQAKKRLIVSQTNAVSYDYIKHVNSDSSFTPEVRKSLIEVHKDELKTGILKKIFEIEEE